MLQQPDDRGNTGRRSSALPRTWYSEIIMIDLTWLETAPLADLMARPRDSATRRSGGHLLFAKGVHSADEAVPRRVPLLHLRRAAACRPRRPICRPTRCWRSHAPARPPAAPRRCSPSATSPNCATARRARRWPTLGHETTISYLRAMCALVLKETTLLPHVNPGVMTREEIAALREVSASQGIMLESTSERLCQQGGVHYGSPDKLPAVRLETIASGRRTGGAVHHRHPDRHRRNPGGTAGCAGGDPRPARAVRPHPGSDRAEFPRQAGHQAGERRRARSRRSAVDHRRRAADPAGGRACPGAAQSVARRLPEADRRRASTTGAACRRSRPTTSIRKRPGRNSTRWRGARRRWTRSWCLACRSIRPGPPIPIAGCIRKVATRVLQRPMPRAGRATTTGPRA